MRDGVRSAIAAVSFLTAWPVGRSVQIRQRDLETGALFFPVVGALVGATVATAAWAASLVLPAAVAGVTGVAAGVVVTAALHLDGLADVADGVGASLSGRDAARAMRDPRLGVFGVSAAVLDLSLRMSVLAALVTGGAFPAEAIAAGAISRVAPLALAAAAPYIGPQHRWTRGVHARTFVAASILATVAGFPTAGAGFAAMVLVSALATGLVGRWATAHLGGMSGDVFGAVAELSETLSLAVALGFR